ncbi:MAG: DUF3108 domain-containing protein [Pseudohongiellaceae bacterium]
MLNNRILNTFCLFFGLLLQSLANFSVAAPLPFSANYDARFQGLKARAEISLTQLSDTEFVANSLIKLRLLGATVSTIRESSQFEWQNDSPRPHHYEYRQSGIGGRSRSVEFDWQNNLALATVRNETVELLLEDTTLDELSMYSFIREELKKGKSEITFAVIDRNVVEEFNYRIVNEEEVVAEAGTFSAVKVERIRENSERLTQLWFAKNNDMLLIKLFQRDPDGDEFEITLSSAQINGEVVLPQSSGQASEL